MQVKIGPKFFANELRVYRDWRTAFWRENIQNSFDAGADRIDITIGLSMKGAEDKESFTKVEISDNGCGMNRETLDNVYFTLGETTKASGDSVGGFGKARILTCFAQMDYVVRTQNLYVEGCGADYTIEDTEVYEKGTRLGINVFDKGKDLVGPLKAYLKQCHLVGCAVYVNGEKFTDWTYKNKMERRLSFGTIYANKSKEAGVLVRVNGVQMFSPYCSAPFLVVIEIDKERSRDVLQASRDGLLSSYQDELESFISELNINKQSALRAKQSKSIHYEGTGTFTSRRSKTKDAAEEVEQFLILLAQNNLAIDEDTVKKLENVSPKAREEFIHRNLEAHNLIAPSEKAKVHSSGFDIEHERKELNFDLFDTYVLDDTSNPKVRKVIESYYPQNWDLLGQVGSRYDKRYDERRSFRAGVDKYKLLVLWKAACDFAIRLLQDELQIGGECISWGIGWIFSDTGGAAHLREGGVNWLLLNPCDSKGKMRFSISDKPSMAKLVAHACHEVAHIIYGDHDERFANLLDDIHEKAFLFKTEIVQHMKASKEAAEERLNRIAAAT